MFFPPKTSTAILGLLMTDAIKVQGKSHNAFCILSGVLSLKTGMLFTDVVPHVKTLSSENCRQDLDLALTLFILEATHNKRGLVKVNGHNVPQEYS